MDRRNTSTELNVARVTFLWLCLVALSGCATSAWDGNTSGGQLTGTGLVVRLEVPVESGSLLDRTSVGTGFMLSPQVGVTAAHVFNQRLVGQPLRAEMDGRPVAIEVVGQDLSSDVAVFRLMEGASPGIVMDRAYQTPEPGQQVFVAGFPLPDIVLDRQPSLTGGIISAVDRAIKLDGERHDGLIQLDAVASYGNSGGPVMNASGQVIGMLVLAASGPQGEWRGAAFAVPIGRVTRIADEILSRVEPSDLPVLD